jgi:predicted tellurium resistance membrane protein TerC
MQYWIGWTLHPNAWISLLTLTALEIVLGLDNLIFVSIACGRLPVHEQAKARNLGLALALVTRILFLCSITWIMSWSAHFWSDSLLGVPVPNSGKDFVLASGGLFLIWKSVTEIHHKLEGGQEHRDTPVSPTLKAVVAQILILDIVFSVDSVVTAVGMANELPVMILAVVIAMIIMVWFVGIIGKFVEKHPTIKMLALAFLIAIGFTLLSEGFHQHVNKAYVYVAMGFAAVVEFLNLRARGKGEDKLSIR